MLSYKNNENINIFSFIEEKTYSRNKKKPNKKKQNIIYTSKQILTPLKKFIFPIKQDIGRFVDANEKFRKAQSDIIKKIRITTITDPFDSITFKKELLENIDEILDLFLTISEQKLFTLPEKKSILIEEYQNLPIWFKKRGFNSIACWLVAHFENRIVQSYYKYDEDDNFLDKTSLDLVDNFIGIWEKIEMNKKKKIIQDLVRDYCKKVDKICFIDNNKGIEESGVKERVQNLDDNEKIFKLFLMNCDLKDLDSKKVQKNVIDKLLDHIKIFNDKEFVEKAIYISLEEVFMIDAYFLSLLVMKLDQLRYQDFLKSDIEILDSKKKNKKRKRKNKNKKHLFSSVQENNSVTVDGKSDTVASLPNNKFNIKDKKEIIIEKNLKLSSAKNDNKCKSISSFKKNQSIYYSSVKEDSSFKDLKRFSDNNEKIKIDLEKNNLFVARRNSDITGKKFEEKKNLSEYHFKNKKYERKSIKSDINDKKLEKNKSIKSDIYNKKIENNKSIKSDLNNKKKTENNKSIKSDIKNKKKYHTKQKKKIKKKEDSIKSELKPKNCEKIRSIKSERSFKKKNSDKEIEIKSASNKNLTNIKKTSVKDIKNKSDLKKEKNDEKINLLKIEKKIREPTPKKLLDEYFQNPTPKILQQKSLHNQNVFSFQKNRRTNSAFKKKVGSNSTVFYQIKKDEYLLSNSITNTESSNFNNRGFNTTKNGQSNMNIPFDLKELEKKNLEIEGVSNEKIRDGNKHNFVRNKSSEQEKRNKFKDDLLYKKKQKIKKKKKIKNIPKIINVIKWSDKEDAIEIEKDWGFDKVKKLEFPINDSIPKKNKKNNSKNTKKSKKSEEGFHYVKKIEINIEKEFSNLDKKDLKILEKDRENLELNIDTNKKEIKKNIKKKKKNIKKKKRKKNTNSVKTNLSSKTNNEKILKKTIFYEKISYWKDEEEELSACFRFDSPEKKEKKKKKIQFDQNSKNKRRKLTLTVSSPNTASAKKRRNTVGEQNRPKQPNFNTNDSKIEKRLFQPIRKLSDEEKNNLQKFITISYNNMLNKKLNKFIQRIENHSRELSKPREIFLKNLKDIIKETFKNKEITIKPYGSYSSNLLTPFSDIDISIQGCKYIGKEKAVEMLATLESNFKKCNFITKTTPIFYAQIPILKIEADSSIKYKENEISENSFNLKIDIVVDLVEENNILSTSFRTTDYINYCIKEYPTFYKNILFLKYLLSKKNLSDSYKGGLNAYALGLLYIAYLEHNKKKKELRCFDVLISFINFLVNKFDPNLYAVYLNNNSSPFVSKQLFEFSYLVIFDPTSYIWKNVTPNGILFPKIVYYFQMVLKGYFSIQNQLFESFKDYEGQVNAEIIEEKVETFFEDEKYEDILYHLFYIKGESFLKKDDK